MLNHKIKNRKNGILLYGLTPPKITNSDEKIQRISNKQKNYLKDKNIDGIVLYDIQDESDRIQKERPFPFIQTIEPSLYWRKYWQEFDKNCVLYQVVGNHTEDEFKKWLEKIDDKNTMIFVGKSSKSTKDFLSVKEAFKIKKQSQSSAILGGIAIPERHFVKKDEHKRVLDKTKDGCEFFITQAVYDLSHTRQFLLDYAQICKNENILPSCIVLTLTPCGNEKTLDFIKWLGISIPEDMETKLKNSENMLEKSVEQCIENFKILYDFAKSLNIPIGANIESVSIRKEEIEAALTLVDIIYEIMHK